MWPPHLQQAAAPCAQIMPNQADEGHASSWGNQPVANHAIYRHQKLLIACDAAGGIDSEIQSTVEGLIMISLPIQTDCTVTTIAQQ